MRKETSKSEKRGKSENERLSFVGPFARILTRISTPGNTNFGPIRYFLEMRSGLW
jgi:hypothetical protein